AVMGERHDGPLGINPGDLREDARVTDPQVRNTTHPKLLINDGVIKVQGHGVAALRMPRAEAQLGRRSERLLEATQVLLALNGEPEPCAGHHLSDVWVTRLQERFGQLDRTRAQSL